MTENSTHIAHISDLHFGAASAQAVSALVNDLEAQQPDIIVITGDLTQAGRRREFEAGRDFLNALSANKLIVPGNHDLPVINLWSRFITPYNRFERYMSGMINPIFNNAGVTIVGLNTARRAALDINWSYGRLSRSQILRATENLENAPMGNVKIIAAHHPFVLGPGRAGSRTVGRGAEALSGFAASGLDIALTGHVHHSSAEIFEVDARKIVMIQAGTATSIRTRQEPPAYNDIKASTAYITVETRVFHGNGFMADGEKAFRNTDCGGWASG